MRIFTVIYYKMPIPCNNMVNSIENAHIKGSCGMKYGMKHPLLNLYQDCSNYILGAKTGPASGVTFYIGLYRVKHEKILLSLEP